MQDIFVYDNQEPSNCEAWKNLPSFFQDYITAKHENLRNYVYNLFRQVNLVPFFTSGFRSVAVNKKVGGVSDSMHLYGLAVDFTLQDKFRRFVDKSKYKEILDSLNHLLSDDYTIIVEKTHYHCQFNRKK